MDVIFEGQLSPDLNMSAVLDLLHGHEETAIGLLRINSSDFEVCGRLAIDHARYIIGARLFDSPISGYAALRTLLSIKDGSFSFLSSRGQDLPEASQALHIDLERLQCLLPDLPDNASELFDEHDLLDRVFAGRGIPVEQAYPTPPDYRQPAPTPNPPIRSATPEEVLDLIEPALLTSLTSYSQHPATDAGHTAQNLRMIESRAFHGSSDRVSRKRLLLILLLAALVIGLLMAATMLGSSLISQHTHHQ